MSKYEFHIGLLCGMCFSIATYELTAWTKANFGYIMLAAVVVSCLHLTYRWVRDRWMAS